MKFQRSLQLCTRCLSQHFIGPQKDRFRDCDPECLRNGRVDRKGVLGWLLDWQFSGIRTSQYLVDVLRGAAPDNGDVKPVRHHATGFYKISHSI